MVERFTIEFSSEFIYIYFDRIRTNFIRIILMTSSLIKHLFNRSHNTYIELLL